MRFMISGLLSLLFVSCLSTSYGQSPVDKTVKLEEISTEFGLCDGPSWDGQGSLYIPDVKGQKLYRYWPKQDKMQVSLPEAGRISATYFNHGKLYLSDNGNSRLCWLQDKKMVPIVENDPQAKPPQRPNDLVVDNQGGIYYTLTSTNQVMYVSPEGQQSVAVAEIATPNGIILSPDERTLYVSAYVPKEIYAYQIAEPGKTQNPRLFATMDDGDAKGADGMCIDRAGNVYCAGAADVWIWSPSGTLLDKITPPTRPINCAFGDFDMQSLYITCFGGLYRQRMKITGDSAQPISQSTETTIEPNSSRPSTVITESVRPTLDVVYAQYGDRRLLADIFSPSHPESDLPAVVVVHGGGWLKGDKTKFRALAIDLAKRGYVTMAIEYRLGGEAKFPAAIYDCNAAVRYLRAHADEWHIDPSKIGAVGGSAGGHLVGLMATGHDLSELQGAGGHREESSKLQAAIVMAGPMQISTGSVAERARTNPEKANATHWIGPIDQSRNRYELADAYRHISSDDPPILFMVGEHDNPERNQPSRDRLDQVGVATGVKVYKDGKHGCWNQLPWFDEMVADMDQFFREHLK
ncbi:MAG: SMP-30/gluconolactonase/LRE family protein [Planctomycetaceae bacterium]|nr:SMP-30/gluconolactonase/LRE family protein [Planctomycetaceae bacterium]